jgi:hypothetical protein
MVPFALPCLHFRAGIGENIRGTALGAVDTIAHDKEGEIKNEQIGQKGRLQTEQGLGQMSGHPRAQATSNTVDPSYTSDPSYASNTANPSYTPNTANPSYTSNTADPSYTSDYPKHHRDDEVYNDHQAQAVYEGNNYNNSQPASGTTSGQTGYGQYGANDRPTTGL